MKVCVAFLFLFAAAAAETLIWQDEFDFLDDGKWHTVVTANQNGNGEFQYYRNDRKNSYVEDGVLKIRPTPVNEEYSDDQIRHGSIEQPGCNQDPCVSQAGGDTVLPVFSAKLTTQGHIAVTYGRIEVRAKTPDGDWLWPAIWMLPDASEYGTWPASGEIDIMESRGNRQLTYPDGTSLGANNMGSTLHWGPYWPYNGWGHTHWEQTGPYWSDDFHTYSVEWTDQYIKFSVDGNAIGQVNPPGGGFWELGGFQNDPGGNNVWANGGHMAPFDKNFYVILNVAVGGSFFPDGVNNANYPRPWDWNSGHPLMDFYERQNLWQPTWARPSLEVDYVRIYSL